MTKLRIAAFLMGLGVLAACGADGEPITPTLNAGIGIGPGGVVPRINLGIPNLPIGLNLGL
ncbi:MAG: hypothetical protein AB8B51_07165 [Sedimentitalea sp.]